MPGAQVIGRHARAIELAAQRYDAGVITHRPTRVLFAAIGHRRTNRKILVSAPLVECNLESTEERIEQRDASPASQFASLVSQVGGDLREPSLGWTGRDRDTPHPARVSQ